MSRKKFVTYLLIILTLVMIVDIKYVHSDNHLFQGFITESIEEMIKMEGGFFQNNFDSDSIKVKKEGSLVLGENFLAENKDLSSFYLKNDFGSIDLRGTENQEIKINYTFKVHAEGKEAAEEFIKNLKVVYNLEGERLKIALNKSQTATPALIKVVEIDYQITVPRELKAELINKYGSLTVSNLDSELEAKNRYGSTNIDNIAGSAAVSLDYGEAEISNLGSNLDLELRYADCTIERLRDYELYNYDLEVEYGSINADLGEQTYKNRKELSYQGRNAEYEISIRSEYGDIDIR